MQIKSRCTPLRIDFPITNPKLVPDLTCELDLIVVMNPSKNIITFFSNIITHRYLPNCSNCCITVIIKSTCYWIRHDNFIVRNPRSYHTPFSKEWQEKKNDIWCSKYLNEGKYKWWDKHCLSIKARNKTCCREWLKKKTAVKVDIDYVASTMNKRSNNE